MMVKAIIPITKAVVTGLLSITRISKADTKKTIMNWKLLAKAILERSLDVRTSWISWNMRLRYHKRRSEVSFRLMVHKLLL